MTRTGLWRFALPLWDVPAVTGEAPAGDTPPPSDDGGSLDAHEAEFGLERRGRAPVAEQTSGDDEAKSETRERDETGKFTKPAEKPRHRAASQRASAEDVPRINELTKRLREAEARAEAAERRASGPREQPVERRQPAPPAVSTSDRFPKFEAWLAQKGNEDKDWDDWMEARDEHSYARRRAAERAEEAATAAERERVESEKSYESKLAAAHKKYADFEEVVSAAPKVSAPIEVAVLAIGPEAAYYLATHPDEAESLTRDTLVARNNPAFKAVVASTRRYLETLVASEQRPSSSSRTAAAPSGSALALAPQTPPKPPNPGRTGGFRDADDPPGDDENSLAAHEQAFKIRRRA